LRRQFRPQPDGGSLFAQICRGSTSACTGPSKTRSFEGTEDEKLAKFREIRDQIEGRVQAWLEEQEVTPQKL
jgi:hypothetical protein